MTQANGLSSEKFSSSGVSVRVARVEGQRV